MSRLDIAGIYQEQKEFFTVLNPEHHTGEGHFDLDYFLTGYLNNMANLELPYHNLKHVINVYNTYRENYKASMGNPFYTYYIPLLAILFHDQVIVPGNKDNEEASVESFHEFISKMQVPDDYAREIRSIGVPLIMYTKSHNTVPADAPDFVHLFLESDMAILGSDWETYLEYAKGVRKEYSFYSDEDYTTGRRMFLQSLVDYKFRVLTHLNEPMKQNILKEYAILATPHNDILAERDVINYLFEPQPIKHTIRWEQSAVRLVNMKTPKAEGKKCVYAGSFMPITNGHNNIIKKACKVFDEVRVLIADNPNKQSSISPQERKLLVALACLDNPKVTVDITSGYVAKYAEQEGIETLIRGLRPVGDFDGELQLAMANKVINPNLETIFIPCNVEDSYVSSSLVRELVKVGSGEEFVAPSVYKYLARRR